MNKSKIYSLIIVCISFVAISQAQNVGVGTKTPLAKLHVKGQLRVDTLYSGSLTNDSIVMADTNGVFKKLDATKLAAANEPWYNVATNAGATKNTQNIYQMGNVGIGTSSPNAPLQFSNSTTGNRKIVLWEGFNDEHQFFGLGINAAKFRFQVFRATDTFAFYAGSGANSSKELMRINGDGNVGIGTSTPLEKLEVNGNVRVGELGTFSASGSANYGNALLFSGAQGMLPLQDGDNSDPLWIARYNAANNSSELRVSLGDDPGSAADKLVIGVTPGVFTGFTGTSLWTPYFTFDTRGFLGIGTSNPVAKLDLTGIKFAGAGAGTGTFNNAATQAIIPAGVDGIGYLNDWPLGFSGGLATWDVNGSSAFFTSYISRSDRKLKENILDMNRDVVSQVMKLRPVTYTMKERTPGVEGLQYGFIAQEVRELFPSIVTKTSDEEKGTIGMNYQALIAPLVKVVQTQQAEIDLLKDEIELLKKMIK